MNILTKSLYEKFDVVSLHFVNSVQGFKMVAVLFFHLIKNSKNIKNKLKYYLRFI